MYGDVKLTRKFSQDLINDYSCTCAMGYTGKNCSVDEDECFAAECPENSTCREGTPGTFECICDLGLNCTGTYIL